MAQQTWGNAFSGKWLFSVIAMIVCLASSSEARPYTVTLQQLRNCRGTCCLQKPTANARVKPWTPPLRPRTPVVRRSTTNAFRDPVYLAKYRRAYQLLRARPNVWNGQIGTHCAYCAGDILSGNVHFCDLFLPWHRFYLYWHERILQNLLNDTSFALPYWDWDNPRSTSLPTPYTVRGSSLYNPRRNSDPANQRMWVSSTADAFSMRSQIIDSSRTTDFFGSRFGVNGGGSLEGGGHAGVHNGVAQQNPPYTDMGVLATASRDPVFYAHHANVDRLWSIWKRLGPDANGNRRRDPSYRDYLESTFLFFDERGDVRSCKVKDAVSMRNLGYTYQDVTIPWLPRGTRLSSASRRLLSYKSQHDDCKPTEEYRAAQASARLVFARAKRVIQGLVVKAEPTTVKLGLLSPEERGGYTPTYYTSSGHVCKTGTKNVVLLSIKGIQFLDAKHFKLHIFVNNPNANMYTPKDIKHGFLIDWAYLPSSIYTRTGVRRINRSMPMHNFLKLAGLLGSKELSFTFVVFEIANGKQQALKGIPDGAVFAETVEVTYA